MQKDDAGELMQDANSMVYHVPLIAVRYVRHFFRFMQSRGVGRKALLEGIDLQPEAIDSPDTVLSMHQVMHIVRQAEHMLADERAAFQFGQELDLTRHGLLGFALIRQRDQRELIRMIVQYLRVSLPILDQRFNFSDDSITITLRDPWGLGELRPFMVKVYMGSIHALASLACSRFSFEFDFPTRLEGSSWREMVNDCEMTFDADVSRVTMRLSGRPVRDGESELAYYLAGARSKEQVRVDDVMEVVMQVRQQIMNHPGRESALERVAERIGMSPRSLRRQLALAGFSFHDIRNEIRETFATRYLVDTRVPLDRIAERLGYSDQASFTKAYRSWTGRTPGSVRRNSRRHAVTPARRGRKKSDPQT